MSWLRGGLKIAGGEDSLLELGKERDERKHEGDRERQREACC